MVWVDLIIDTVGYMTARLLLPLLTFGWLRVQGPSSRDVDFGWLGFGKAPDGAFVCRGDTAGWIGLIPWAVGLMIVATVVRG